jgi:hypothetical protein
MRTRVLAALALPATVLLLAAAAAGSAALPGGTSFEVHVTAPADGAVLPEATPIVVSGQATVGAATPVANTSLITAIDVSGSTANPVSTTACGNQNPLHDSVANTVLDCELAAAKQLNASAVSAGTVADVGLIGFAGRVVGTNQPLTNEAAPLGLSPTSPGQTLVAPSADEDADGTPDVEESIASAYNRNILGTVGFPAGVFPVGFTSFSTFTSAGNTNYWAAVTQIRALAATAPAGLTKIAMMLSDGDSTVGSPSNQPVGAALTGIAASGLMIYTFAIGNAASCAGSGFGYGTLQEIADASGATCTRLANPADAVTAVPSAIGSTIRDFGTSGNGSAGPYDTAPGTPVPPATLLPDGSLNGPGTATFSNTYAASSAIPGPKTLCVRATGADGGGPQTPADCVDVTIKARPTVTLDGGDGPGGTVGSTPEGSAFSIGGAVSGTGTTTWSAAGGTGTCTFGDLHAARTTVTCTDDGTYALTLTVDDGINAPFSTSEHLLVDNVRPALVVSKPVAGASAPDVTYTGTVTDPGSNDVLTCLIDWGDGSTDTVPVAGGFCTATHSYAASRSGATIVTSAIDDDGGASGHVTRVLTFNQAPLCVDVRAIPPRLWPPSGGFRLVLLRGATDPDGDRITYQIVSITQDEALGRFDGDHHAYDGDDDDRSKKSKRVFPDAARGLGPIFFLRAWRDPHGDGRVYTISFTVTDSQGATCTGTTAVTVPHDQARPAVQTPGVSVDSFGS